MITHTTGNLFDSDAQYLINTVNCVGVPGKGLAKQFAERYPEQTQIYIQDCRNGLYQPGTVRLYTMSHGPNLLFAATKDHWRNPSQYPWIEQILTDLSNWADRVGPVSVAMPPTGAGLGGLNPIQVRNIVCDYLGQHKKIHVQYYG